jgi:alpha/beta superfamily hydrolase
VISDANHFFENKIEDLVTYAGEYVDRRTIEMEKERKDKE